MQGRSGRSAPTSSQHFEELQSAYVAEEAIWEMSAEQAFVLTSIQPIAYTTPQYKQATV